MQAKYKNINDKGYPNYINIEIEISNGIIKSRWNNIKESSFSVEDLKDRLDKLFKEQEKTLIEMYKNKPLTFLNCQEEETKVNFLSLKIWQD